MIANLENDSPIRPAVLLSSRVLPLILSYDRSMEHCPSSLHFPLEYFHPPKTFFRSFDLPANPIASIITPKHNAAPLPALQHGFAHQVTNLDHLRYAR
jgi:hypothetical protein